MIFFYRYILLLITTLPFFSYSQSSWKKAAMKKPPKSYMFSDSTEFNFDNFRFNSNENGLQYYHDNNVFRDNSMFIIGLISNESSYPQNLATIYFTKSDKDPIKSYIKFSYDINGSYRSWPRTVYCPEPCHYMPGRTYYEGFFLEKVDFVFDNNLNTIVSCDLRDNRNNNSSTKQDLFKKEFEINIDSEVLLKHLKKSRVVNVRVSGKSVKVKTLRVTSNEGVVTGDPVFYGPKLFYGEISLKDSYKPINKLLGIYTPTVKNSSYIYKMHLVNANPFDLESYIDKFIEDAKLNHDLDLSYVNSHDRLIIFRQLESNTIALAAEKDNDEKVLIFVDPENWQKANQSLRWYIIYHELGHDILNLEHGECGPMMNPTTTGKYSWSRFENDNKRMFTDYKLKYK